MYISSLDWALMRSMKISFVSTLYRADAHFKPFGNPPDQRVHVWAAQSSPFICDFRPASHAWLILDSSWFFTSFWSRALASQKWPFISRRDLVQDIMKWREIDKGENPAWMEWIAQFQAGIVNAIWFVDPTFRSARNIRQTFGALSLLGEKRHDRELAELRKSLSEPV